MIRGATNCHRDQGPWFPLLRTKRARIGQPPQMSWQRVRFEDPLQQLGGSFARDTRRERLFDINRQQLRARDYVVERVGGGFTDRRFSQDDHVLGAAHVVHDVHHT